MIARHWHGTVQIQDEEKFESFLNNKAIPKYVKNPGFMDYHIIKKYDFGVVHFNVITYWQNFDYIKKFTGANVDKAKYFPEDSKFLTEKEDKVKHYEVIDHVLAT